MHGTEADGASSKDYCRFCYQHGAFTGPDITMDEIPEAKAHRIMTRYLPHLKRWKLEQ